VPKNSIQRRYEKIKEHLDEKRRRLWCANEAIGLEWGGVSVVSKATGVSRTTITEGVKELEGKKNSLQKQG